MSSRAFATVTIFGLLGSSESLPDNIRFRVLQIARHVRRIPFAAQYKNMNHRVAQHITGVGSSIYAPITGIVQNFAAVVE